MAERVVDRLEAVEVEQSEREVGAGIGETRLERGEEGAPVGEAGQRIGVGDPADARFLGDRRRFGLARPFALAVDDGARAHQLDEAAILQVDQAQRQKGDQHQADADAEMGEVGGESERDREGQGEEQQRQARGRREAAQPEGAADRGQGGEQDEQVALLGAVDHLLDRPDAAGGAEQGGEQQGVAQLGPDLLRARLAVPHPHPVDQAADDQQDEQVDRVEQQFGRRPAGELEADDVGERDRIDERDLPLERAVADLQQLPAESGVRLTRIEDAVERARIGSHRLRFA